MRILFVSHRFPPAHTAGTETYAYNLARRMVSRHPVLVFHGEKRPAVADYTVLEGAVDGVPTACLVNNLCHESFAETFENPSVERAFVAVLDRFRPEVVHVHHLMFLSLQLPRIAAERGIPVVMTLHDFFLACPRGGRLQREDGGTCPGPDEDRCPVCCSTFKYRQTPWEGRAVRALQAARRILRVDPTRCVYWFRDRVFHRDLGAGIIGPGPGDPPEVLRPLLERRRAVVRDLTGAVDRFLAPSRTVGERMKRFGLPAEKMLHWPYGIDRTPFHGIRRPERRPPVFGCFSALMPHKGVHVFVKAAAILGPERVRAVVKGAASQNPAYARTLRKAAGPAVRFDPPYTRASVRRAFEEIDVLVVPSLWLENAPLVIQEAFASGCPVLASDLGGMEELVEDGVNGRRFPPGDAAALARVMEAAAREPGVIDAWRKGITPPRSVEDDAAALETLYTERMRARK